MIKLTQNKTILHRIIAFVMAVVMVFTLVAVDSHFHLFANEATATDANTKSVDITELFTSKNYDEKNAENNKNNKMKIATGSEYIRFTVDEKTAGVSTADVIYTVSSKAPATPTDKVKTHKLKEAIAVKDLAGKHVNFYLKADDDVAVLASVEDEQDNDDPELVGTLSASEDETAPEINVEVKTAADKLEFQKKDNGSWYLLGHEGDASGTISITAKDADGEVASINCYDADGNIIKTITKDDGLTSSETDDGAIEYTCEYAVSAPGTYTFTAVDDSDNESQKTDAVIVKKVSDAPKIISIKERKVTQGSLQYYMASKLDDSFVLTVNVKKSVTTDGTPVGMNIVYKFSKDEKATTAALTTVNDLGEYTYSLVVDKSKAKDKLDIQVEDECGAKTNAVNDGKPVVVFLDESSMTIGVEGTLTRGEKNVEYSTEEGANNWAGSMSIAATAESANSYLESFSYMVKDGSGNQIGDVQTVAVTDGTDKAEASISVSGGETNSVGNGQIKLVDGEYTVVFKAADYSSTDNSAEKELKIYIDNTAPTAQIKLDEKDISSSCTDESKASYVDATGNKVTFDYSDELSEVDTVTASYSYKAPNGGGYVDQGSVDTPSDGIELKNSGFYEINLVVTDKSGNETKKTAYVYVNTDEVTTNVSLDKVDGSNRTSIISKGKISYTNGDSVQLDYLATGNDLTKGDVQVTVRRKSLDGKTDEIKVEPSEDASNPGKVTVSKKFTEAGVYSIVIDVQKHNPASTGFEAIADKTFSATFCYDKTAPTAQIKLDEKDISSSCNTESNASYVGKAGGKVTFSYGDELSGVKTAKATYKYKAPNGGGYGKEVSVNKLSDGIKLEKSGTYRIDMVVTDNSDNTTTKTAYVYVNTDGVTTDVSLDKVDGSDRTSIISKGKISYTNGSYVQLDYVATGNDLTKKDVRVTVLRTSLDGKTTYEKIKVEPSEDASNPGKVTVSNKFTEAGVYSIVIEVQKHNPTSTKFEAIADKTFTATFCYDKTAPTAQIKLDEKDISSSCTEESKARYVDATGSKLTFDYSDELSGVKTVTASYSYKAPNGGDYGNAVSVNKLSDGIKLEKSGFYRVNMSVTDKSGNITEKTAYVYVNIEEPTISAKLSKIAGKKSRNLDTSVINYTNGDSLVFNYTAKGNDLTKDDVVVTIRRTSLDGATSDQVVEADINESKPGVVNVSKTFTEEGSYSIKVEVKKHNSGVGETKIIDSKTFTTSFYYDKTAPGSIVLTLEGADSVVDGVYYYSKSTTPKLHVTADENNKLIGQTITYKLLGKKGTISADSDGKIDAVIELDKATYKYKYNKRYTLELKLTDKPGNSEKEKMSVQLCVSTKKPVISVDKYDTLSNDDVELTWKVSADSGIRYCDISYTKTNIKTGSSETVKNQSLSVASDGSCSKIFRGSENAAYKYSDISITAGSNVGTTTTRKLSKTIVIDEYLPTVALEGGSDRSVNEDTTLTFNFEDVHSFSASDVTVKVYYRTYDTGKWSTGTVSAKNAVVTENGKKFSISYKLTTKDGKATEYYFTITGADKAGNELETTGSGWNDETDVITTQHFYIDKTNPEVGITTYFENENENSKEYTNGSVTLDVDVTEQFSVLNNWISVTGRSKGEEFQIPENGGSQSAEYTYTTQGQHTIDVSVVDGCGNRTTEQTTFYIDREAPTVSIEQPTAKNNSNVALTFSMSDNMKGGTYTIHVLRKTVDGDVVDDKDIASYTGKAWGRSGDGISNIKTDVQTKAIFSAEGRYEVTVTATDMAGNSSSDKVRFRIDKTKPVISIVTSPENGKYYNQDVDVEAEITDEYAVQSYKVVDKNGTYADKQSGIGDELFTFSNTFDTIVEGADKNKSHKYELEITATDDSGNAATPKKVSFIVDKTKPGIEIGSYNTVNSGDVILGYKLTDDMKGGEYTIHVIRKDANGNVVDDSDIEKDVAWDKAGNGVSQVTVDNQMAAFTLEGDYEVTISATDKAGNKADSRTAYFRIDRTAPVIDITGMNDQQTTSVSASISVSEEFSLDYEHNEDGKAANINVTITKKTDGTAESSVTTFGIGDFSAGNPHTVSYSLTEDGEYTITASASDLAGNVAAEVTRTFKIDGTAPVLTVETADKDSKEVKSNDVIGSSDAASANYVDMSLSVEELFYTSDDVSIVVKKDGKDVSSSYFKSYSNSAEVSRGTQRFSEDGVYNISVSAKDELGNAAEDYNIVFTIDNVAPTVERTAVLEGFANKETLSEDGTVLLNASDFADILSMDYEALWNVTDTSMFGVSAKLDGVDLVDFSDMSDGYHKLYIEVTDQVGHVTSDSFEFTYDGIAPRIIITGVEDGDTMREPFLMTISLEDEADEITSIVINGNTIDPANYENNRYEMQVEEYNTYEVLVTAADKAGNISSTMDEETESVFTFRLSEKMSPVMLIIIIVAAILLVALLIIIIIAGRKRRKNAAA